jgi:hypothetical protein
MILTCRRFVLVLMVAARVWSTLLRTYNAGMRVSQWNAAIRIPG